jgi:hypothetical protein
MARAVRGCAQAVAALLSILGILGSASTARSFEFLEGRLQVHGYFEEQFRTLSRDFDASDDFDLAQWYHVLDVEVDYNVAPDGWGPFDFVSLFARVEGRYDCVWSRGCGLSSSADAFGDRANRLPDRLSDAHERGYVGNIRDGDWRHLLGQRRDQLAFGFRDTPVGNRHKPGPIWNVDGLQDLFAIEGPDGILETFDDPGPYVFERFLDYRFAARKVQGPTDLVDIQSLGPWLPKNRISPAAQLMDRPNPIRAAVDPFGNVRADGGDTHPVITYPDLLPGPNDDFVSPLGVGLDGQPITPATDVLNPAGGILPAGSVPITDAEKPFRPAPDCHFADPSCPKGEARGLFIPNAGLAKLIRSGESLSDFDQNFRQAELEWNRGASQQDEKELKELYVDLELFDSQLWLRAGKQNIVWGKTELFRTTDQFDPQDFGLATLPTLEESRIPLWSIRGVWSFYDLWFLRDARLEIATNFDQVEPVDLGRCGEPFAINLVCLKAFGLFGHGVAGLGLAGEIRPDDPWDSWKGVEAGARLEFRLGRMSFQISDFYGYSDLPTLERVFTYEHNVDPRSGMPRRAAARGPCSAADGPDADLLPDRNDPDCLQPGQDALRNHSANQTLFAVACASSIGFNLLEPSACGVSALNSRQLGRIDQGCPDFGTCDEDPATNPIWTQFSPLTNSVSLILLGEVTGRRALGQFLGLTDANIGTFGFANVNDQAGVNLNDIPLIRLVVDVNDNRADVADLVRPPAPAGPGVPTPVTLMDPGLDGALSREQEALLGCGPFYEVQRNLETGLLGCHQNGVDLLNAEASVLVQSWPGIEGTSGTGFDFFAAGAAGIPVPGTRNFVGGPVATRTVGGQVVELPGSRGPFLADGSPNPDYDVALDGTPPNSDPPLIVDNARHPLACQSFSPAARPTGCQEWRSEMAAVSWNLLVALVMLSGAGEDKSAPENQNRLDFFNFEDPFSTARCSFVKMHLCQNVQLIWTALGTRRNTIRAGGQNGFGRRDFAWHQGGTVVIRYDKRNVLGFAFDFSEDVTKSNWGFEAGWIAGVNFIDNDEFDGLGEADTYNLTVSVDRPTFINFLNANRTFFFNSQWFFQYIRGYKKGFTFNGPFNVLGTFSILAGYYQDRLLPQLTFVYDFQSNSGGVISQLTYRFSERFSATFGINTFMGRVERKEAPINDLFPNRNRVGRGAYKDHVENLLALFRDKDEMFLVVRYTF